MHTNYAPIGEYIKPVDERNSDSQATLLLGVSINKHFMPSVANIIGTDLTKYKVIRRNQFACSLMQVSRDEKIPVDRLADYEIAIVSPAYHVFEVADTEKLMPEYLAMWFKRSEFDREASFLGVGGVRGSMTWADFCGMKLPVPSLDRQKAVVKAYQTITDRIALKRAINDNLEATAGAAFANLFGATSTTGYESDNEVVELGSIVDFVDGDRGFNYPKQEDFMMDGYCLFLNASNVTANGFSFDSQAFISKERDELLRKGKLARNDIVLTSRGTVGNVAFYGKEIPFYNIRINSGMLILRAKSSKYPPHFIYALIRSPYMAMAIEQFTSGSAQPQLPIKDLQRVQLPLPPVHNNIRVLADQIEVIDDQITLNNNEILQLRSLGDVLLANLAR